MEVMKRLSMAGLIPVVVIEDAADAVDTAKALLSGGLDVMEITMRTAAGIGSIRAIKKAYPEMLVGSGTVLTVQKARESMEAGAEFIVAPGFNPKVVEWCIENNLPVTPGCVTPTEIETALSYGIKVLKFFPANLYGGIKGCRALYGPYKSAGVSFVPTGGISNDNLAEYADKPYIHAVGGSWMCNAADIKKHNYSRITAEAAKAVDILLGLEPTGIGNEMTTINMERAVYHLAKRGFSFDMSSAQYDEGNKLVKIGFTDKANKEGILMQK